MITALWAERETIGYLILLVHLLLIEKYYKQGTNYTNAALIRKNYIRRIAFFVLPLLLIHVLIHEGAFFLFLPIHTIITWSTLSFYSGLERRNNITYVLLLYLPVVICFTLVCFLGRPTFELALSICRKWEAVHALAVGSCQVGSDNRMWALPGAITALPWPLAQLAALTHSVGVSAVLAWLFTFVTLGVLTVHVCGITADSLIGDVAACTDKHLE
jgi:hypothetical protein